MLSFCVHFQLISHKKEKALLLMLEATATRGAL